MRNNANETDSKNECRNDNKKKNEGESTGFCSYVCVRVLL